MTKKIFTALVLMLCVFISEAQVKKPTVMILPSDNWCYQRYYVATFCDLGVETKIPDYSLAFSQDTELGGVISKVGEMLNSFGFIVKDCEQELRNINLRRAEDNVSYSSTSNSSIAESPIDEIKRRAKADIIIQIGWQVNKEAIGKSVTFTLEAFDSYTSKRIATASGTGKASNDIIPRQLEDAISLNLRPFVDQMDKFFVDLSEKGREIIIAIKCWNSSSVNLETEYGGIELIDGIHNYLSEKCVNGDYNLSDVSETAAQFEQVRIPLTGEDGRAMDARTFAMGIRKYLKMSPYFLESKVLMRGLGEANIIIGEK